MVPTVTKSSITKYSLYHWICAVMCYKWVENYGSMVHSEENMGYVYLKRNPFFSEKISREIFLRGKPKAVLFTLGCVMDYTKSWDAIL